MEEQSRCVPAPALACGVARIFLSQITFELDNSFMTENRLVGQSSTSGYHVLQAVDPLVMLHQILD
jgi:hypothetical protein